jgi:hypothetical protein
VRSKGYTTRVLEHLEKGRAFNHGKMQEAEG